jgi:GNAT superfamily N-acetyltransferase
MMTDATQKLDLKDIRISPLTENLVLKGFKCGDYGLDRFIANKSMKYQSSYRARIFCAHNKTGSTVFGLYSLTLLIEQTDKLLADEKRHYQNEKHFPAIYIQSLAVLRRYQRGGLGTILLMNALTRAHMIAQNVAVFGVALRSLNDDTTRLYKRYGFGIRDDGANPLMVLPIWSLDDIFKNVRR